MIFSFRVTVKPRALKKDNPCKQETVKSRERASQRTRLFLGKVAEHSPDDGLAPGRHPSLFILDSAGGNEPHMHKLVGGTVVIPAPFAISSSVLPLVQIERDVSATSGTK